MQKPEQESRIVLDTEKSPLGPRAQRTSETWGGEKELTQIITRKLASARGDVIDGSLLLRGKETGRQLQGRIVCSRPFQKKKSWQRVIVTPRSGIAEHRKNHTPAPKKHPPNTPTPTPRTHPQKLKNKTTKPHPKPKKKPPQTNPQPTKKTKPPPPFFLWVFCCLFFFCFFFWFFFFFLLFCLFRLFFCVLV